MTLEVTCKKTTKTTQTTSTTYSRVTTESSSEFKLKVSLADVLMKLVDRFVGWIASLFPSADTS
jgi:hypothetical protein